MPLGFRYLEYNNCVYCTILPIASAAQDIICWLLTLQVRLVVRRQDKQLPPLVPTTAAAEDRRTGLPEAGADVRRRLCGEGPAAVPPPLADKKDAARMRRRQTAAAAMTVTEEDRRRQASTEEDPRGRRKKHSQRLCQTRRLDTVHPR
jgi:hypothetical protein